MSNQKAKLLSWAIVLALGVPELASAATVPAFSAPGLSGPGYPSFWDTGDSVRITRDQTAANGLTYYTLSVSQDTDNAKFNFEGAAYDVANGAIHITAHFDPQGNLINSLDGQTFNNTYELDSKILPAWNDPTSGTKPDGYIWGAQNFNLFSATLSNAGADTANHALGFLTVDFGGWANQLQFTHGSEQESLWLYTAAAENPNWDNFLSAIQNHTSVPVASIGTYTLDSIITVPLPPAVWLFGSALAAIVVISRRGSTRLPPLFREQPIS